MLPWFILAVVLLFCIAAATLSSSLVAYVTGGSHVGSNASLFGASTGRGASTVATGFMNALKARNYSQAYQDLDDTLLVTMTADDFAQQGRHADACYGTVSWYQLAKSTVGQGTARYIYTMKRVLLSRPYQFQLTLQLYQSTWTIIGYGSGNTLNLPDAPPCSPSP